MIDVSVILAFEQLAKEACCVTYPFGSVFGCSFVRAGVIAMVVAESASADSGINLTPATTVCSTTGRATPGYSTAVSATRVSPTSARSQQNDGVMGASALRGGPHSTVSAMRRRTLRD
jgi:hypothetical protein